MLLDNDTIKAQYGDEIRRMRSLGYSYQRLADELTHSLGFSISRSRARRIVAALEIEDTQSYASTGAGPASTELVDTSPAPAADEPIEELLQRRLAETARSRDKEAAREFTCSMPLKPWALMLWGDPHLDNPGCRWDLLMRHVRAVQGVEGILSVNLGDSQDSWVGRLMRLYSSHSTTAAEGWRLARWFMGRGPTDANLRWLAMVGGNHDAWAHTTGYDPYAQLCEWGGITYYDDAEVRIRVQYAGDAPDCTLLFRHDLPGRSWFHPTHGPSKAAMLQPVDLVACGHLHQWGSLHQEHYGGRTPLALRVRGYKEADHYAREKGFTENRYGHGVLVVVRPDIRGPGSLIPFWDIETGVEYLQSIRSK